MEFLRRLLDPPPPRPLLWFLVLINLVGAAFGYNWYAAQLSGLPAYTWIVVADSPLSVTGLAVAAFLRLRGRIRPWLELWSALAVIKYGAWAALLWLASWSTGYPIYAFDLFGLFLTHIGMVLEGLLVLRHAPPVPARQAVPVLAWFFLNDYFDYVHRLHPTILARLFAWCAATAVLLSCFLVALYFLQRKFHRPGGTTRKDVT